MLAPITLPTDNLYKFLAIAGITLVVVAIVVPWSERDGLRREEARLLGEHSRIHSELKSLNPDMDVPAPTLGDIHNPDIGTANINAKIETAIKAAPRKSAAGARELTEYERSLASLQAGLIEHRALVLHATAANRLFWCVLAAGIALSGLGFGGWFLRLQRKQDAMLSLELLAAKEKLRGDGT
jgi:hypothetical protein